MIDTDAAVASLVVQSPIGPLLVEASQRGVRRLGFLTEADAYQPEPDRPSAPADAMRIARDAAAELHAYFAGALRVFSVPLDLRGTPFQLAVWSRLLAIPYGRTISYRDLALSVGAPQGFRAVGRANGANPVAIIVPCHRVIANDGALGGYAGGLERKAKLLDLERQRELLFSA